MLNKAKALLTWKRKLKIQNVELGIQNSGRRIHNLQKNSLVFSLLYVLALLLLLVTKTNSQSIDSLIEEAVRNNPQIKALQHKIISSEYHAESVNALPPPNLGFEFSQIPVSSINVWNDAFSNSLSLSQMFPIGGKIKAMTEVEKKNILVERNNLDDYSVNLIAQLKMTYYNLWLIERKIEVQQKTNSLYSDLIKSLEMSYTVNRLQQSDLLILQSEIASNKTQIIILENQRDAEIYKINKLLGRNLDSKDVYVEKNIKADSLSFSQQQLEEALHQSNPQLNKMSSMIEMNKAMIEANNKELIPDLMIQGMIMRMPQGMPLTSKIDLVMLSMETPKTEYMYSLMASINLPFAPWSINKYKAKEEELAAGISSIEYEKNDMRREMEAKLKSAFVKAKTNNQLIELYRKEVIPNYQQAIEAQILNYQNNRTNINSIIELSRMQLMQQMNYYMAQADLQMAIAEMEMMIGKNLKSLR